MKIYIPVKLNKSLKRTIVNPALISIIIPDRIKDTDQTSSYFTLILKNGKQLEIKGSYLNFSKIWDKKNAEIRKEKRDRAKKEAEKEKRDR